MVEQKCQLNRQVNSELGQQPLVYGRIARKCEFVCTCALRSHNCGLSLNYSLRSNQEDYCTAYDRIIRMRKVQLITAHCSDVLYEQNVL